MPAGPGQILGSRVDGTSQRVYMADVTQEGAVCISGVVSINGFTGSITIGSVSANVDIGSVYIREDVPTALIYNNPAFVLEYITSGLATGVTGSSVGRIVQFINTGSYVQTLTWNNNLVVSVGSYG